MRRSKIFRTGFQVFILLISALVCVEGYAMRGGGGGRGGDFNRENDYNRGDYRNGMYYDNRLTDPTVVVGVPEGSVDGSCSMVQDCDNEGNCVQSQVCN